MSNHINCNLESRSERFNLPVCHPSRWTLLLDQLLATPRRLHRYRDLSRRIAEETMLQTDCARTKRKKLPSGKAQR